MTLDVGIYLANTKGHEKRWDKSLSTISTNRQLTALTGQMDVDMWTQKVTGQTVVDIVSHWTNIQVPWVPSPPLVS